MAQRRRRPRHLRRPKIYGYTIPEGIRRHAGDAMPGSGLYSVAWRDVHRKRRPAAEQGLRDSYYFAFSKGGGWREPPGDLEQSGMSRTHWMLQELIREYGFVQCDVNGVVVWFEYDAVELEKRRAPIFEIGKGARRTDISGIIAKSNLPILRGTEVATEIGVTSLIVAYDRYFDLVKSKVTTLEIIVERNKKLEENPTKLLNHLKKLLLDGGLKGRWICAPWRKDAKIKPIDILLAEITSEIVIEETKITAMMAQVASLDRDLNAIPAPEALSSIDRRKLNDLDKETSKLIDLAVAKNKRDTDDVDFFTMVFELIFPSARSARFRSMRAQLGYAMGEIRNVDSIKRSGLLSHFKKMESALIKRNDEQESRRREILLKKNFLRDTISALQEQQRTKETYLHKLRDLKGMGMTNFLIPSGTNVENAIAFEHRRWMPMGRRQEPLLLKVWQPSA